MEAHHSPQNAAHAWLPRRLELLGWTHQVAPDLPAAVALYLRGEPVSSTALYKGFVAMKAGHLMVAVQQFDATIIPTLILSDLEPDEHLDLPPSGLKYQLRFRGSSDKLQALVRRLPDAAHGMTRLMAFLTTSSIDDMHAFIACCKTLALESMSIDYRPRATDADADADADKDQSKLGAALLTYLCDWEAPRPVIVDLTLELSSTDLFDLEPAVAAFQSLRFHLRSLKLSAPEQVLTRAIELIAGPPPPPPRGAPPRKLTLKLESLTLMPCVHDLTGVGTEIQAAWQAGWPAHLKTLLHPPKGLTSLSIKLPRRPLISVSKALDILLSNHQIVVLKAGDNPQPKCAGTCVLMAILTRNLHQRDRSLTPWTEWLAKQLLGQVNAAAQLDLVARLSGNLLSVALEDPIIGSAFLRARKPATPAASDDELDAVMVETVKLCLSNDVEGSSDSVSFGLTTLQDCMAAHCRNEPLVHAAVFEQLILVVQQYFQPNPDGSLVPRPLPGIAQDAPECTFFTRLWLGERFQDFVNVAALDDPVDTGAQLLLGGLKPLVTEVLTGAGQYITSTYAAADPTAVKRQLISLATTICQDAILPWLKRCYCEVMAIKDLTGVPIEQADETTQH